MTTLREVRQYLQTMADGRSLSDPHSCEQAKRMLREPEELRIWACYFFQMASLMEGKPEEYSFHWEIRK